MEADCIPQQMASTEQLGIKLAVDEDGQRLRVMPIKAAQDPQYGRSCLVGGRQLFGGGTKIELKLNARLKPLLKIQTTHSITSTNLRAEPEDMGREDHCSQGSE
ncbi:hypothetical protein PRK78_002120 [Emydomyces testavorans]|uniref:Uncharacterized protein n=1 Tax=Emydomyces testavorans TaxID=2070801 RepID=A0AAF0DDT7_9EURO|nr:hypothetical protein PRK78_002120 [Emydomyces testavorans]